MLSGVGLFNFSGRSVLTCEHDLYQCGIVTYMSKGNRNKATCLTFFKKRLLVKSLVVAKLLCFFVCFSGEISNRLTLTHLAVPCLQTVKE